MITIINKIVNIYVPDTILIPLFKYVCFIFTTALNGRYHSYITNDICHMRKKLESYTKKNEMLSALANSGS